jgi:hypothetical protein
MTAVRGACHSHGFVPRQTLSTLQAQARLLLPRSKPSEHEVMFRKAMKSTFTSNKAHHSELTAGVVRTAPESDPARTNRSAQVSHPLAYNIQHRHTT